MSEEKGQPMIPFTERLDERRSVPVNLTRDPDIETMAAYLIAQGYAFGIEVRDGAVYIECARPGVAPVAEETCRNGPGVVDVADRIVMTAYLRVKRGAESCG